MSDIFQYHDYRLYLKDVYEEQKVRNTHYSFRFMAKRVGFSSPNFLQLIMQGKRNLSHESILKISRFLKLNKAEAEFFENLVHFNQSRTDEERNTYYARLSAQKQYLAIRKIEKVHYEYFSQWYHAAIRELVLLSEFQEDPAWIAQQLHPLSPQEAATSLTLLQELGFIVRDKSGKLTQQDRFIDSGDDILSLAVANYHRAMITKALESIEGTSPERREINALTFAVSKKRIPEMKSMIQEFRKKMGSLLAEEKNTDEVYQLNIQFFNLTKKSDSVVAPQNYGERRRDKQKR